jgi:hypothetical protein
LLIIRPKFWVVAEHTNDDLAEAGWGYWTFLTKDNVKKIQTVGIIQFASTEKMRMQTYREAVLEAYLKARKRAYRLMREPAETRTDHPVEKMVDWFEQLNLDPNQFMDITTTGKYADATPCKFGDTGLIFPDDPYNPWWPNDYNIPKPNEWKMVTEASGDSVLRTWE